MKAEEVVAAVRRHFGSAKDNLAPEWAALDEFKVAGPYEAQSGRADLFLVRAWSGRPKGHERVLVEVKVSRADLRAELADPDKMKAFSIYAHRVYFAAPVGLVRADDDLGDGVGLIEVSANGCRQVRKAARNDAALDMPERALVEALRRAARAETRIRTATEDDPAALVVRLGQDLARAERAEQTAREAASRDTKRLHDWMGLIGRCGGVPCTCVGGHLKASRDSWRTPREHADGSPCTNEYGTQYDAHALAVMLGLAPEQAHAHT